jgi:Tfp pilus assembly protein PilE
MMKFSIRTLLVLVTVSALAMVAYQSHQRAVIEQKRCLEIAMRIDTLEQNQAVRANYRTTKLARDDLNASLQANRDRCEQAIQALVQRYSSIEPVDAETLSIRRSPAIRTDASQASLLFRLFVPANRPTWLKLGIHPQSTNAPSDRTEGSEDVLLVESVFNHSGPFELRLPPGEHVVALVVEDQDDSVGRFRLRLNEEMLTESVVIKSEDVRPNGYMSISAEQQIDFAPSRMLPRLVTFRFQQQSSKDSKSKSEVNLSVWLSDRSSSFSPFSAHH